MKVLLIGGTGTLSTDICKYCLEKKYDVTIINRGNNNRDVDKKVKILTCDVRDVKKAREILGNNQYDVIVDFISFNKEQLKTTLEIFNNRCYCCNYGFLILRHSCDLATVPGLRIFYNRFENHLEQG